MEQLPAFLDENHLPFSRQHGFRKGRYTSDLLLLLSQSWYNVLKADLPSLVITLDIAGAFDCVALGLLARLEQLGDLLHLFSKAI